MPIGKVENTNNCYVLFGGDVRMEIDSERGLLLFSEGPTGAIGRATEPERDGVTMYTADFPLIFRFTSPDSIDALILTLQEAKAGIFGCPNRPEGE